MVSHGRPKKTKKQQDLFKLGMEIKAKHNPSDIGFLSPHLIHCTLPYKDPGSCSIIKTTPWQTLRMWSPPEIGIPFGSMARLIMAYIQTRVRRTRSDIVEFPGTLTEAAEEIGIDRSSKSLKNFSNQLDRYFYTSWSVKIKSDTAIVSKRYNILSSAEYRYDEKHRNQIEMWKPVLKLNMEFYEDILNSACPFRMSALRNLAHSPLSQDLYLWIATRAPRLKAPLNVSYRGMMMQFGTAKDPSIKTHVKDFKKMVKKSLMEVQLLYQDLNCEIIPGHLVIKPSPDHIPRIVK